MAWLPERLVKCTWHNTELELNSSGTTPELKFSHSPFIFEFFRKSMLIPVYFVSFPLALLLKNYIYRWLRPIFLIRVAMGDHKLVQGWTWTFFRLPSSLCVFPLYGYTNWKGNIESSKMPSSHVKIFNFKNSRTNEQQVTLKILKK